MKSLSHYLIPGILVIAAAAPSIAETPQPATPPVGEKSPMDAKTQAAIKGYIWPTAAGIEGARASAAALESLSTTEPFNRKDARKAADIADKSLTVAHDSAEELSKMKELSPEARTRAQNTVTKLKAARETLDQIKDQVGVLEGLFERNDADKVHRLSSTLTVQIQDAQKATQGVADMYEISVSKQFSSK